MTEPADPRVEALKTALDNEVHGLWLSDEMAIKVLAAIDHVGRPEEPNKASTGNTR